MKVRYTPRARGDIEALAQHLAERSPGGAANVLRAIYAGVDFIAEHPEASARADEPETRVKIVVRYRYKIFYRIDGDAVDIVHIRHAARRPWTGERR